MSGKKMVPYGDNPSDTATLLLAAADDLGLQPDVVETTSDRVFRVPEEVATKAGVEVVEDEEPVTAEPEPEQPVKRGGRRGRTSDKEQASE